MLASCVWGAPLKLRVWRILGPFGTILVPFWEHVGTIFGEYFRTILGHFGTIFGPFGDDFGTFLGAFWEILNHFRTILGNFNAILIQFWNYFGTISGPLFCHFGTILSNFGTILGCECGGAVWLSGCGAVWLWGCRLRMGALRWGWGCGWREVLGLCTAWLCWVLWGCCGAVGLWGWGCGVVGCGAVSAGECWNILWAVQLWGCAREGGGPRGGLRAVRAVTRARALRAEMRARGAREALKL